MKLFLAAALILLLSSCSRTPPAQARDAGDTSARPVAVARVKTGSISRELVLTAEFKPFQEIDVMSKVAGYIKQINVDIGDRVKEGQTLAILQIPEMEDDRQRVTAGVQQSEAQVRRSRDELTRAKAAHEMSHVSYERLEGVNKQRPGLVAQQEIDDARSKDLVAEAQVSAAQSALDAAEQQVHVNQAEVAKVKTMFDYTTVTAPFTGVIIKRYADTGSMIQAGTASQTQAMPVVRLAQNDLLRVILPVPESSVPSIHLNQTVTVRVPTLNRNFTGKVARFSNQLSLQTRTMDTEVDVPNPGYVLVPGMYAEVDLSLTRRDGVLTIPVTAVDLDEQGKAGRVLIVTPNRRVEARKVTLGLESASDFEVTSGLNEGDMVVIGSRSSLQAGDEVKPVVR